MKGLLCKGCKRKIKLPKQLGSNVGVICKGCKRNVFYNKKGSTPEYYGKED